jgi:hypothetical protein
LLFGLSPPTAAAPLPSPAASGMARIWVYRTFEPSVSRDLATVAIDGRQIFLSPNGQARYIDAPAGQSQIWVKNATESPKSKAVNLAAGQVAFARIVVSDNWLGADGGQGLHRPTYDVKLEPVGAARNDIARLR